MGTESRVQRIIIIVSVRMEMCYKRYPREVSASGNEKLNFFFRA
jgi:hypothetical protein